MSKLKRILLVDDSRADNFLHKTIIGRAGVAEKIDVAMGGEEALEYLKNPVDGDYPKPDIIFLDINMPGMNGWEFLEHYAKIPKEHRGKEIIVMLTTSLNPEDRERAEEMDIISYFENKPLKEEKLQYITQRFFSSDVTSE
ncbi:MAG: response regulator [Luteibaculum sp.]